MFDLWQVFRHTAQLIQTRSYGSKQGVSLVGASAVLLVALGARPTCANLPEPPDDPHFPLQWALLNTGQEVGGQAGVPGADLGVLQAWQIHGGRRPVVVAIVDSGVEAHPEFGARLLEGISFAGDPRDWSDSCDGRGTFLAGLVAARADNAAGIAGLHDGVHILPVRILDGCAVDPARLASGIEWAVDHGAEIVVVALELVNHSAPVEDALAHAVAADVLVIAPTGDDGVFGVRYPAAYEECLAVSSTTSADTVAPFSRWGPEVDLAAPGENIFSTAPGSGYVLTYEMTGAAAAYTAGVAALIRSYNPTLTAGQIRQILIDSAKDIGPEGWDEYTGAGRLDAGAALALAPAPALRFEWIDSPPHSVPPGRTTGVRLRLAAENELPIADSIQLWYRSAGRSYVAEPLQQLSGDIYNVVLPAMPCGSRLEYYLAAEGHAGTAVMEPAGGPGTPLAADVQFETLLFADTFETTGGWTAITVGAGTVGAWERADPEATNYQPEYDYSAPPGNQCFVTGPLKGPGDGSYDVDGGPVRLLSPVIDLQADDAEISFASWFWTSSGTPDVLAVELSRDGGNTWTVARQINEPAKEWRQHSFRLSEFPQVTGHLVRVRFSVSDSPPDSLTEAAIDDFRFTAFSCLPIGGDYNTDGFVDLLDQGPMTNCLSGPASPYIDSHCFRLDFDKDQDVDLDDVRAFFEVLEP